MNNSTLVKRVEDAHLHFSHPERLFGSVVFTAIPLLDEFIASCLLTFGFAIVFYFTLSFLSYFSLYVWGGKKFTPTRQKMREEKEQIGFDIKWSVLNIAGQTPLITAIKMCYPYFSKVQYNWSLTYMFPIYFMFHLAYDQFFTYWIHRLLHYPGVYGKLHYIHHKSKAVTPFSGFAFHPIDAFLQALPVFTSCFFVPLPIDLVLAHGIITSIWAISIHDNVNALPFKGILFAGSHSIHHFPWGQNYNYGKITSVCDRLYGTYCDPIGITGYGYKCNSFLLSILNRINSVYQKIVPDNGKVVVEKQSRKLAKQKWQKRLSEIQTFENVQVSHDKAGREVKLQ